MFHTLRRHPEERYNLVALLDEEQKPQPIVLILENRYNPDYSA